MWLCSSCSAFCKLVVVAYLEHTQFMSFKLWSIELLSLRVIEELLLSCYRKSISVAENGSHRHTGNRFPVRSGSGTTSIANMLSIPTHVMTLLPLHMSCMYLALEHSANYSPFLLYTFALPNCSTCSNSTVIYIYTILLSPMLLALNKPWALVRTFLAFWSLL